MKVGYLVTLAVVAMVGIGLAVRLTRDGSEERAPKVMRAGPASAEGDSEGRSRKDYEVLEAAAESVLADAMSFDIDAKQRAYLEEQIIEALAIERVGDVPERIRVTTKAIDELLERLKNEPKLGGDLTPLQQRAIEEEAKRWSRELVAAIDPSKAKKRVAPPGHDLVHWSTLTHFDYEPGMDLPEDVRELDGTKVAIDGYMLSTSYEPKGEVREFLLTESMWGCCFARTPQVHEGIVARGNAMRLRKGPITATGTLEVGEKTEDGEVTSVYRLRDVEVVPLDL